MLENITNDIRRYENRTTAADLAETALSLVDKYFCDVADLHNPFEITQARAIVGTKLMCRAAWRRR